MLHPTQANKILIALGLLVFSIILYYFYVKFGLIIFVSIYGLVIFLVILIYELRWNQSYNRPSLLVPLLVLAIPIQRIFLSTLFMQVASQLLILLVIFFYLTIYSSQARYDYLRKIRPLFFPTIAFAFSILLSYVVAGGLDVKLWANILYILGSIGYAYLACIYCNSLENIKKILWVFVGIGIIQLPIMYAISQGWTGSLPGALQELNKYSWGGVASPFNTTAFRYPGTFGDYELIAEYFDILVLICVGFFMFSSRKRERVFSILSMLIIITAGFYTGTRTFILGIGIGLVVMGFFMTIKLGIKKYLGYLLIFGIFLGLIIALLSSDSIFGGYINRFLNTSIGSGNFDSRTDVWTISILLIHKMPFWGYGASVMELFNATANRIFLSPHSLYFSMLLRSGYPGLIAILVMIFAPIFWMVRILFNNTNKTYYAWAIVFLGIVIFWMINEIKMEFIRQVFYMNIIFFFLGIFASYYDLTRSNLINPQKNKEIV